ncbi:MAG: hypothetical protein JST28_22620 [Acidobacteria bacterium]|nr:hypothetical protein [Acidobacteriota bacterium]
MRMCRTHLVLFAFTGGAFLGLSIATILASIAGILSVVMHPVLIALWPTSVIAMTDLGGPPAMVKLLIVVALFSNAILYGFVFAIPLVLLIVFRRSFGAPEKPPSIGRT